MGSVQDIYRAMLHIYYGTFVWQRRIGQLMPKQADLWWELHRDAEPAVTGEAVVVAIRDFGLPAMRQQLR